MQIYDISNKIQNFSKFLLIAISFNFKSSIFYSHKLHVYILNIKWFQLINQFNIRTKFGPQVRYF